MLAQQISNPAPSSLLGSQTRAIETRFGLYEFGPQNYLYFPSGLLGFSRFHDFAIGNLPQPQLEAYKLLQCLSDPELSFIVTPLMEESGLINPKDLREARETMQISAEDAAYLLIVTLRQQAVGLDMTVNLRAPIVVDLPNQRARQTVLQNSQLDLQHSLANKT